MPLNDSSLGNIRQGALVYIVPAQKDSWSDLLSNKAKTHQLSYYLCIPGCVWEGHDVLKGISAKWIQTNKVGIWIRFVDSTLRAADRYATQVNY